MSWFWAQLVAGFVRLLGAIGLGWLASRFRGNSKEKIRRLKEYQTTRKEQDEADEKADEIFGDDPAAARRFLRERGSNSDLR